MKKMILASSIAVLGLSSFSANAEEGSFYINPSLGYLFFDGDRELDDAGMFGVGLEYQFAEHFGVELSGFMGSSDREDFSNDTGTDVTAIRLDGLYYLPEAGGFKPYLAAGYNSLNLDFDSDALTSKDYDEDQFNIGGGVRYAINEALSLRGDLRFLAGESDDLDFVDTMLTVGLSFALGGASKPAPAPEPEPVPEPPKPVDSDGDGVFDNADQCPATAAGMKVDATGCPLDSDGDGVLNASDQCPNTPSGASVDTNGCPLDSDNDGVADYMDQCPQSLPDARVDSKGCKLKKVRVDEMKLNVRFPTNSSVVTQSSLSEIEAVADFMKKHADLVVDIEGHTDSLGKAEYNKLLSQRRADSVAKVLVETFGIEAGRVNAIGYGEEKPIASNDTKDGRQQNRRVVAVLQKEVEE
ncbi:MAG: OmpA family protein [Pseudomonadales bacterium]|nr:OmpA family protein [Pseudomonadales bacterium]